MPRTFKTERSAKRYPLTMRTTKDIRQRLETAAEASGRSLVAEVESRLERTFEFDLLAEAWERGREAGQWHERMTGGRPVNPYRRA